MFFILLPPEALDRWTVVSARDNVAEGIAKRAIMNMNRSCCRGEGIRGGGLQWLNCFWTLTQPHKFKIPLDLKIMKG